MSKETDAYMAAQKLKSVRPSRRYRRNTVLFRWAVFLTTFVCWAFLLWLIFVN